MQLNFLRRLGDWSYSIYMVHMPIIFTLMAVRLPNHPALFADDFGKFMNRRPTGEGLVMCVIIVLLTLVVSSQTYKWVEVPARNYLNKWFNAEKRQIPSVSYEG
jgi:peptidoglycan/LPS O-acetylase OafA/YrhL